MRGRSISQSAAIRSAVRAGTRTLDARELARSDPPGLAPFDLRDGVRAIRRGGRREQALLDPVEEVVGIDRRVSRRGAEELTLQFRDRLLVRVGWARQPLDILVQPAELTDEREVVHELPTRTDPDGVARVAAVAVRGVEPLVREVVLKK